MPMTPFIALLTLAAAAPPASAPREDAGARIMGTILASTRAWDQLAELTDAVGPRLSGSSGDGAAVAWALKQLQDDGLRAWTEPVRVRRWERRSERGWIEATPGRRAQPLALTALGGSPGTPPGGLAAEVIEVHGLDELERLGDGVRGRTVLFQHDMASPDGYGRYVALRTNGPAAAAKLGAVAALVRSLATASLRTPHTGQTTFPAGEPQVPAAALATEDAELIHRRLAAGPVRVRLVLDCGMGSPPEVESANVLAEVRGRERPEEIVLVGAHLDSWDLATGAVDDGAGVVMVLAAMRALAAEPRAPRRTVRAVLFANEENGLRGAFAYAERHASELAQHVAAIEADSGAARPIGFEVDAGAGGQALLARLVAPLAGLGAARVEAGHGGADLIPLRQAHVAVLQIRQDGAHYFDWHHSAADTLDKVDPRELAQAAAALATATQALAEAAEVLPRPTAPAGR